MKLAVFVLVLGTLLASGQGDDKHLNSQQVLYTILHDLALPRFEKDAPITERFILLQPGQVLDYYDYCPYEKLEGKEKDSIPPSTLPPDENTFMLSDKLPTLNPLAGGLTEKKLSVIYRNILYTLDTTVPGPTPSNSRVYKEAMDFLNTEVTDPNEPEKRVPRFELYHRYETKYYDAVMEMKRQINGNRTLLNGKPGDYETWYHENYGSLLSHTSGAYSQWLINGQKSQVEDNVAIVDVESARKQVEDARRMLQNMELPSMDGGSSYYPVHLTPSNWYKYLLANPEKPTREQIQVKITSLKMRLIQLQSMMNANQSPTQEELESMQAPSEELTKAEQQIEEAAKAMRCYEYLCQAERAKKKLKEDDSCKKEYTAEQPCDEVNEQRKKMDEATAIVAQAKTASDSMANTLKAYSVTNTNLKGVEDQLKTEIDELERELESTPIEAPIIDKANKKGEMSREDLEKNWMSFSFDSQSSMKTVKTKSNSYKTASSFSASGLFWSVKGGASFSRSTQDFQQQMSSASVGVSAKLLRVTINRNWFRPSIFSSINFLTMQKSQSPVSPGPKTDERVYVEEAISERNYQLPEYTTGFLLAKDVVMTFRGMDSSTSSHAVQQSASAQLSGSYGPFSASTSFSHGHESSNLRVSSQSDGLHIEIPGAQIIGYYTAVLPRFPNKDPHE